MRRIVAGSLVLGARPALAGVIVDSIDLKKVRRARALGADLVEVRVDTFRNRDPRVLAEGFKRIRKAGLPVLLTVRDRKEGGRFAVKEGERLALFLSLLPFSDLVDIELGSTGILKSVVDSVGAGRKKVIVSYHNFRETPAESSLADIVGRARRAGAHVVKLATRARGREDLRTLARVLLDHRDLIAVSMGVAGAPSRVLFPALGSLITYGSITATTAPGQMPLKTLLREMKVLGLR